MYSDRYVQKFRYLPPSVMEMQAEYASKYFYICTRLHGLTFLKREHLHSHHHDHLRFNIVVMLFDNDVSTAEFIL